MQLNALRVFFIIFAQNTFNVKKQLLITGMLALSGISFAQTNRLWTSSSSRGFSPILENMSRFENPQLYHLNISELNIDQITNNIKTKTCSVNMGTNG